MRQRWQVILGCLIAALLAVSIAMLLGWQPITVMRMLWQRSEPTIRLGLIHSKTGYLAISEKSLLDAELMAIEEINAAGGVANRQVVWSAPDCQSDPAAFATQARRLIDEEGVAALFGTWTSECRKAVLPVVEAKSSLLFFPGSYEGMEKSPRVVYAGGAANQVVLPAVRWAIDSLKTRRFFVVGLDDVWSRCTSEIAKDGIKAGGGELVGSTTRHR